MKYTLILGSLVRCICINSPSKNTNLGFSWWSELIPILLPMFLSIWTSVMQTEIFLAPLSRVDAVFHLYGYINSPLYHTPVLQKELILYLTFWIFILTNTFARRYKSPGTRASTQQFWHLKQPPRSRQLLFNQDCRSATTKTTDWIADLITSPVTICIPSPLCLEGAGTVTACSGFSFSPEMPDAWTDSWAWFLVTMTGHLFKCLTLLSFV